MRKVLAIDDEKQNLIFIKGTLKHYAPEIEFIGALEGKSGLKMAEKELPDVILLDIMMPIMDGYEVCKELKSNPKTKNIPVIMLSGVKKDTESRVKGLDAGADAFLSKPIDPPELAAQVNVMLRIKAAEDILRDENKNLEELVEIRTKQMLENELKFRTIVENSEGVIFLLDTNGVFLMAEGKKRAEINVEEGDLVGKSAFEIYRDNPEVIKSIRLALKGEMSSCLVEVKGFTFDIWFSPHYDGDKSCIGVIGMAVDITEMKVAEKRTREALEKAQESDRLKSAFLSSMSHELRTPLNAIIGFSEILNGNLEIDEINEMSSIINNNGTSLLEMVENIFDITLIESGEVTVVREEFLFSDFLEEIYIEIKEEAAKLNKKHLNIILPFISENEKFKVYTDHRKLKQILLNLFKNALKFTEEGNVELIIEHETTNDGDEHLKFDIIDTGIGIEPDKFDFIFEAFRQADDTKLRKYGGAGIGLSVAKKLCELIDGKLWAVSNIDSGSIFSFKIPCSNKAISKPKNAPIDLELLKQSLGGNLVLIAEDDISSYLLLKYLLKMVNIKTVWAKNGTEAYEFCVTVPSIKLVLMDLRMPDMTGYEATRKIKTKFPMLPIIAQTVQALYGEREKAILVGCDDFVTKPINKEKLYNLLVEHLK